MQSTRAHDQQRLVPVAAAALLLTFVGLTALVAVTTSCVVDVNPIGGNGPLAGKGASKGTHGNAHGGTTNGGGTSDTTSPPPPPPPPAPTMLTASRDTVVWKRQRTLENDLMRALALSKDQVCNEVGAFACIDQAHLAALGGNEPFELTQYVPVPAPTVTSPFALERIALSACSARAEMDATLPPSQRAVFTAFDLGLGTVDAASLDALDTSLFHALLARDPKPTELAALQPLKDGGTSAIDVAKLACFTIATNIEFAFN